MLPIPTASALDYTGPEPRTIWHSPIDYSPAVEIRFSPPVMGDFFSISADGNWFVYNFADTAGKTNEIASPGIYIGNMRDGSSKFIESALIDGMPYFFNWSPDNLHFIFEGERSRLYLGNINGAITPLAEGQFLGWIDDSRYLYVAREITLGKISQAEKVKVARMPASNSPNYFTFVFVGPETVH